MPLSFTSQRTIEKTPAYFVGESVPERVQAMNRSVKLLLIVRDPIERAISDYAQIHWSRERRGKRHATFEQLAIQAGTGRVNAVYNAIRRSIYKY